MITRILRALLLAALAGCGPVQHHAPDLAPNAPAGPAAPACKCETTIPPLGQP